MIRLLQIKYVEAITDAAVTVMNAESSDTEKGKAAFDIVNLAQGLELAVKSEKKLNDER